MKNILFILVILMTLAAGAGAEGFYIDYDEAADNMYGYLDSLLDDEELSDGAALSDIADYIEYAAMLEARTECGAVGGNEKEININGDDIAKKAERAQQIIQSYKHLLDNKGIALNRELHFEIPVFVTGYKGTEVLNIRVDKNNLNKLPRSETIRLIYGKSNEYLSFSGEDVDGIAQKYNGLSIQLKNISGVYSLRFLDENGGVLNKYDVSVRLGIPAHSPEDTVYIFYDNKQDNWGGQYNEADGLIEFITPYSGDYSVSKQNMNISDISGLSENERNAIEFMSAREYFELDNGQFKPNDSLSRYDFAQALVRMLFAIDNEAECSFADVDNEHYRFIAAAEKRGIAEGFENHTFRGDLQVTGEQVVAFTARTIHEQKGYIYPDKPDAYLSFGKSETISDWARKETSLAVREGIYGMDMGLDFQAPINRKDAAIILYRLFMILNNTPQKTLGKALGNEEQTVHKSFYTPRNTAIVVSAVLLVDVLALLAAVKTTKKKRR